MRTRTTELIWTPVPMEPSLLPEDGIFLVADEYDNVYAAMMEDGELVVIDHNESDDEITPVYYAEIEAPDFS